MSFEAVTWCLGRADSIAAQAVLFIVANYADEWGITYVGQDRIAECCSCRRATVNANLARLETLKIIARVKSRMEGRNASDHIVLAPLWTDRGSMRDAEKKASHKHPDDACRLAVQGTPGAPSQSTLGVPSQGTSHDDPGYARRTRTINEPVSATTTPDGVVSAHTVNRKRVTPREQLLAEAALGEFNRLAERDYSLSGRTLTCIVMRIREHPGLTADDHRLIVIQAFARPWWKDAPMPVVIYGKPDQFERALGEARSRSRVWDAEAFMARAHGELDPSGEGDDSWLRG